MQCSLLVDSLEKLEIAVDAVLADYKGYVISCKPKLDDPLRMSVVLHVITWLNRKERVPHKMAGKVRDCC